jgi:uncharacterized membrane protein HdeD (DUF308 family)
MATMFDIKTLRSGREALLATNWWAAALRGVSAIVLGLLAVSMPSLTLFGLAIIFAAYCLVDGIFAIVLAIRGARAHQRWGWLALNGILSLIVAGLAMFFPIATIYLLAMLFAGWSLITGALTIAAGMKLPSRFGRWWLIIGGVIAIAFGLLALFLPGLGMLALIYLVGFQALFAGISLLVLAFHLRARAVELARDIGSGAGTGSSSRAEPQPS